MQFIQSKVYPDLYLVKNEIRDRDLLHDQIKQMIIHKVNTELRGKEDKSKPIDQHTPDSPPKTEFDYSIDFYTYSEGWGTNPFGEAGTAHFIEHKEDPGGFSSELLEHYSHLKIAAFYIQPSQKDTLHRIGVLNYYKQNELIKSDTIFKKIRQ